MDFLPGGPEISLEILFRDVALRSFIEVLPTDLAMDLAQMLLIGAWQACGPRDYVSKFDLTHKHPLTHCLGSLAGIIFWNIFWSFEDMFWRCILKIFFWRYVFGKSIFEDIYIYIYWRNIWKVYILWRYFLGWKVYILKICILNINFQGYS